MEAAIGYAVAFSCVMGNRLCLNVRGMVHHGHEDFGESAGIPEWHISIQSDSLSIRDQRSPSVLERGTVLGCSEYPSTNRVSVGASFNASLGVSQKA